MSLFAGDGDVSISIGGEGELMLLRPERIVRVD